MGLECNPSRRIPLRQVRSKNSSAQPQYACRIEYVWRPEECDGGSARLSTPLVCLLELVCSVRGRRELYT